MYTSLGELNEGEKHNTVKQDEGENKGCSFSLSFFPTALLLPCIQTHYVHHNCPISFRSLLSWTLKANGYPLISVTFWSSHEPQI